METAGRAGDVAFAGMGRIYYYSGVLRFPSFFIHSSSVLDLPGEFCVNETKAINTEGTEVHRVNRSGLVVVLALLTLLSFSGCYSGTRPARIGTAAPDFTVKDADHTVTLSQLKGQVVVLNFWATWCPPCIEEMPSLVQMQQQLKAKGVTVFAVSVDADASEYHQFLKDHNVNLLTVRDPDQKSNSLYGTAKFPETYIIDRNGIVRRKFIGAVDWTAPDVVEYLEKL